MASGVDDVSVYRDKQISAVGLKTGGFASKLQEDTCVHIR